MSDSAEGLLVRADRGRVSRRTQEVRVSDSAEGLLVRADRGRVSRRTQEAA